MGQEEGEKKEGKEVKKEEEQEQGKEEEQEQEEIVLKVDMHCRACARKIARSLKGFQGVEEVRADSKASKVVVKGKKADPVKVSERIQKKSRRKVLIISSPLPKPENNPPSSTTTNLPQEEEPKKQEQPPPPVITTVLKVGGMHCEACAQALQKRIRKIQGVESVTTDLANNQVIVKGAIDPEKLVDDVYKRTRKRASLVKDEEEEKMKEDEKKEEGKKAGKEEEKVGEEDTTSEVKRSEHWPQTYSTAYAYGPEFFSDENPNACSVM